MNFPTLLFTIALVVLIGAGFAPIVKGYDRKYPLGQYEKLRVDAFMVVDGDTIKFKSDGHAYVLRVSGIDTPEKRRNGLRQWCKMEKRWALMANARLEELMMQAKHIDVAVKKKLDGTMPRGRYGRVLGVILVDGENAGMILVREGLADLYHGKRTRGWCLRQSDFLRARRLFNKGR